MTDSVTAGDGADHSADSMFPLIYDELRAAAGRLMSSERADHTLQRTALVHEAYAKLAKGDARFVSKAHFFNAAAQAMRRILVDHALARGAQKRGGGRRKLELDDENVPPLECDDQMDWIALDDALTKLSSVAPQRAHIVGLKYFVNLTDAEIANIVGISESAVRRAWAGARAWLYQQMRGEQQVDPA